MTTKTTVTVTVHDDNPFVYTTIIYRDYSFGPDLRAIVHSDWSVRVYAAGLDGEMVPRYHGQFEVGKGRVAWTSGWSPVGEVTPQCLASLNRRIRAAHAAIEDNDEYAIEVP